MERLTFEGNFCEIAQCACMKGPYDTDCSQKQVWERLKAYEDTGLTPKEVTALGELFDYALKESKTLREQLTLLKHIRKLAEADKDGRVLILPCKLGDTVYFALLGRIIEKQVFSIVSFSNSTRIYCGGTSEYFRPEDIGKTFFLAREGAEKALAEMEGKKDD